MTTRQARSKCKRKEEIPSLRCEGQTKDRKDKQKSKRRHEKKQIPLGGGSNVSWEVLVEVLGKFGVKCCC
jgi:hypothetical protein